MIKNHIEKYTNSQDEALVKLQAFMKKPVTKELSSRVFVLKGKAGTGKTTIIRYALLKEIEEDFKKIDKNDIAEDLYNLPNVMGVTLSHKAKGVLSNSIHVCKTFAATFGLKQGYGENGEILFEKVKNKGFVTLPCELPLKVFVHDECSMYDKAMLDMVLKDTNFSSKIIFMGDPGQLPPITSLNDEDSPTFTLNLPEENKHELVERVRQTQGNPILELSDVIYEEIFGSQNLQRVLEYFAQDKVIDGKGHQVLRYSSFLQHYKAISKDYMDTKVVAYRNKRVNEFNEAIRSFVHNNPDKIFIPHEIIYMNDSYAKKVGPKEKAQKTKYICYNSDEYLITDVTEKVIEDIKCLLLTVDVSGHKHLLDCEPVTIPVVAPSSLTEFNRRCSNLAHYAKTAEFQHRGVKWKNFYDFKQNFADVAYGYCFTGHKIQGSGYKNIYMDVNDIITVGPITTKRKLQALYTGSTRAEENLYLLNFRNYD